MALVAVESGIVRRLERQCQELCQMVRPGEKLHSVEVSVSEDFRRVDFAVDVVKPAQQPVPQTGAGNKEEWVETSDPDVGEGRVARGSASGISSPSLTDEDGWDFNGMPPEVSFKPHFLYHIFLIVH